MKGRVIGYTWDEGESDARTILIAVPGYTDADGRHPQLHEEVEVRPVDAAPTEEKPAPPGVDKPDDVAGLRSVLEFYGIERRADGSWVHTAEHMDTYGASRRSIHERGKEAGRNDLAATMERILQHGRGQRGPLEINLRETRLGEIEGAIMFGDFMMVASAPQPDVVAVLEALDVAMRGQPETAPREDYHTLDDEWLQPSMKLEVSAWNSREEQLLAVQIELAGMVAQNMCDEQSGNPISFGENHFINLRIEHDLLPAAEAGDAKGRDD